MGPGYPSTSRGLRLAHLTLLSAAHEKARTHQSIVIRDGRVVAMGDDASIAQAHANVPVWDGTGYIATPGMINSHTHVTMGFFRGMTHAYEPRSPESSMIEDVFFPAERSLTVEAMEALSYLSILEGLRSGTTAFIDAYFEEMEVGKAFARVGVRAFIGEHVADLGGPRPAGRDRWERVRSSIERWPFSSLIQPVVYAHATDTVSFELLKEMAAYAKTNKLPFHMHLSQTVGERSRVKKQSGLSPVRYAQKAGAIFPGALLVHLVSADDEDCGIIAREGGTIGFCPVSEIQYEALPPVDLFFKHRIPLALGTDCAASNDTTDMLRELHMCAVLLQHEGVKQTPSSLLRMVWDNPARVLNQPHMGHLSVGSYADIVLTKDADAALQPDVIPAHLCYTFTSRQVEHVLVNGEWVLWQGEPTKLNQKDALEAFTAAAKEARRHIKIN